MKRFVLGLVAAVALAATFVGCGGAKAGGGSTADVTGDWFLYEAKKDGGLVTIPASAAATISFEGQEGVSGFAGVNNFSGTAKLSGNKISFGELATTMMAGEPEADALEQAVLAVLNSASTFSVKDDTLVITSEAGDTLSFQKLTLGNTSWMLSAYNSDDSVVSVYGNGIVEVPSIAFDDKGNLSGFTGVNQLMGTYTLNNATREIAIAGLSTTGMDAMDENAGALEQKYVELLEQTKKIVISGKMFSLLAEDGSTLLFFVREELM